MKYVLLRPVLKKFETYSSQEQEAIISAIERIQNFIYSSQMPHGLGIKKLSHKIYEARINIHLRIAYFLDEDTIKFFCLGNHDDIKRSLKSLKNRQF